MIVWMVALMYRAYSVSCNVAGGKAIGVFIAVLILAEAISKVLIIAVARHVKWVMVMAVASAAIFNSGSGIAEAQENRPVIAPWTSGEETTYDWVTKQGQIIGETVYTIEEIDHPRGKAYEISAKTRIAPTKDDTKVIVSAKTLSPFAVHRVIHNARGEFDIQGIYEAGKLKIVADIPSGKKSVDVKLPKDAYDNEEVLFLIRAFPLKADYTASFNFAVVATGARGGCTVNVLTEEKLKVPAGEFETYKVEFDFGYMGLKMYAWYGKDEPHYLIKYDNGNILCELKEAK